MQSTVSDELRRKRLANLRPRPRVKGQANRITRDLRRAIVDAAAGYGADGRGKGGLTGYLFFLASKHPKAFAMLLGKLMPFQIDGHITGAVAQINVVSIPADRYLGPDEAAKLRPAMQIEGVIEPTEPGHFLNKDVTRTDS